MLSEYCESVQLPSGAILSSEHFKFQRPGKFELRAEIDFLNGMLYIWIGVASMHQLSNLQIAYPGNVSSTYTIPIALARLSLSNLC